MYGLVDPNFKMYNSKKEYIGVAIIEVVEQEFPVALPLFWIQADSFADGSIWIPEENRIANVLDFETRIQARRKRGKGAPNVL